MANSSHIIYKNTAVYFEVHVRYPNLSDVIKNKTTKKINKTTHKYKVIQTAHPHPPKKKKRIKLTILNVTFRG